MHCFYSSVSTKGCDYDPSSLHRVYETAFALISVSDHPALQNTCSGCNILVTYCEVPLCNKQELIETPGGEELVCLGHHPYSRQLHRGQHQTNSLPLQGTEEEAEGTCGGETDTTGIKSILLLFYVETVFKKEKSGKDSAILKRDNH